MGYRPAATDAGWALAKTVMVVVILCVLAAFLMLSHLFSHARAGGIACADNQRATFQALVFYQMENPGSSPSNLDVLRRYSVSASERLGRCPADPMVRYTLAAATHRISCPNPKHRGGP